MSFGEIIELMGLDTMRQMAQRFLTAQQLAAKYGKAAEWALHGRRLRPEAVRPGMRTAAGHANQGGGEPRLGDSGWGDSKWGEPGWGLALNAANAETRLTK